MNDLVVPSWHVLYAKYKHEKKVENYLKEKEIEVFLPMVKSLRMWSDRKKKILSPLFPRYLFVNVPSQKEFYDALSTDGVIKYVKFGAEYAKMRASEILMIKHLLNSEMVSDVKSLSELPSRGQKMRIEYGPLRGMECEVLKASKPTNILVRVDSIRYSVTAKLPDSWLSRISSKRVMVSR